MDTMETPPSFGHWVRRRRKALDMTQKKLAQCASCSVATIKKIEAEERRPSRQLANLLAHCLAVPEAERETFVAVARGLQTVEPLPLSQSYLPAPTTTNLPVPTTAFIGRASELATLQQHLDSPAKRLISVVGLGGIGKTRLALEAARSQVDRYRDGVWFAPLVGITEADYVPSAIADVLHLQLAGPTNPAGQLRNHLYDKEMLLVLDNYEQLLPDGAHLLSELLQHCPALTLLATSRERLNLRSESVLILTGVSPADGVQLFCRRARQANPALEVTPAVEAAAQKICQLVGGLPLGLELAAAWTRLLTPDEIRAELDQNLNLLTATQHDVPDRHRSMQAVFETSWRRLTAAERTALKQVSVFRGGFTQDAARQSAQASLATLLGLVDKSLLARQGERFRLHELLRQYAAQKLASDPAESVAAQSRHTAYYVAFLEQIRHYSTRGGRSDVDWLADVEGEIDNIRAAWKWAVDNGQAHQLIPAVQALYHYYDIRGRIWEGRALLNRALESAERLGNDVPLAQRRLIKALLLDKLGALANRLGRFEETEQLLRQSLALFDQSEAPEERGGALISFSLHTIFTPRLDEALRLTQEALAIFRPLGNLWGQGVSLNLMGLVHLLLNEPKAAQACLEKGFTCWERLDSYYGRARALVHLGLAAHAGGNYREAIRLQREALALTRQVNDTTFIPLSLNFLGLAYFALGKYTAAREHYLDALRHSKRYQLLPFLLMALGGLGMVAARQGQPEQAATLLTFFSNHPVALKAIMLGQPEQVLAELGVDMPRPAFESARKQGQSSDLSAILQLLETADAR